MKKTLWTKGREKPVYKINFYNKVEIDYEKEKGKLQSNCFCFLRERGYQGGKGMWISIKKEF